VGAKGEEWKEKPKTTTDGEPPSDENWDASAPKPINPKTGQHGSYWVLPEEERKKGFVRPVRRSYVHTTCNAVTKMGQALAETYARDPNYYSHTFCCDCKFHFPVAEFVWLDPPKGVIQTKKGDWTGFEKVGS